MIGANSVVTEDVPAFSIAAGAPARVLKTVTYAAAERSIGLTGSKNTPAGHGECQLDRPGRARASR